MATYYITATIGIDIEADNTHEAAAKAYAAMKAQEGEPTRILVWHEVEKPTGGIEHTSSMFTFAPSPQQVIYTPPEPVQAATEGKPVEVATLVETDAPPVLTYA